MQGRNVVYRMIILGSTKYWLNLMQPALKSKIVGSLTKILLFYDVIKDQTLSTILSNSSVFETHFHYETADLKLSIIFNLNMRFLNRVRNYEANQDKH